MDLALVKTIGSLIVSSGVGTVVSNACTHVRPSDASRLGKTIGTIGSFALGMYVSDKVTEYAEEKFDEIVEKVQENKEVSEEELVVDQEA